jgi:hypothetical protein
MSIQSQDTYLNQSTTLTVIGGGGGAISTYSTFTISSLNALNITAGDITSANISSIFGEFDEVFCSSISTLGIILDDQILTAVGSELLLNGIPIATTANISTLADWSYDPAVSTLNMNGNSSINASLTSTNVINAGSGLITNLVCNDISTTTLTVFSTLHVISTISSVKVEAQAGLFSSINGAQFPGPNSDASQWANFPAVSTITGGVGATDDLRIVTGRSLDIEARVSTGIVINRGIDIGGPASFNVLAKNGSKGEINLTSDPGFAGLYGEINLTANGGTTPGLIGSGGLITLTANTPVGTTPTATSAIKFSAAGINSYAGAIPSIGSLLGYNFIYGTLGVNLCAGLPPTLPNTPGTTYLYGTSGITLGSQTNTGSDITQSAGGLYTTLVTGYWAGGIFSPQNLLIRGRQIPVYGNSYVQLSNVDYISFDSGASRAITGVSTINGAAYPPAGTPIPANLAVSTLTAAIQVSTPALFVSSVNGASYPPPAPPVVIPADLVVSTLTAAVQISTPELFVSSVNGASYPPITGGIQSTIANSGSFIDIDGLGGISSFSGGRTEIVAGSGGINLLETDNNASIFIAGDIVMKTTSSGSVKIDNGDLYVSSVFLSSINGASFPPNASVSPDLVVSTLTAAINVSTPELFVSSVNGASYPPSASVPANLIVSTLTAAVEISTLALKVSTINNHLPNRPVVSSIDVGRMDPTAGYDFEAGVHTYAPIYLQATGNDTIASGVLTLVRSTAGQFTEPNASSIIGLVVRGVSTLDSTQPIVASRIFLNNGAGAPAVATPISGDTAGNIVIPFSSIVGISSINNLPYPAPSVVGIQSSITNAGSLVNIDGGGSIFVSTNGLPSSDVIVTAERFVNIDATSINCLAPTSVSSLTVSSINGAPYGIQSSITNAGSVVNIDPGGSIFISTNALPSSDVNLTAFRYVNVDATLFNCPTEASLPQITGLSSINGAPYSQSTFTQASISSLTASTINGFPAFPAVINRASSTASTIITASTFATAQTIGTVTLSTFFIADVDISAVFTAQATSAAQTDVYYYCTQGGISIGTSFIDTIQGNNHHATLPAQGTVFNLAPSTYTFGIKVYTPNNPGNLVVTPFQIRAIGNLL